MSTPTRRMLIDASHADETRVAIMDGNLLDDFEAETADKAQLKGNIYIGHVSRVEPSLQAAFITYGGNRNGFLAFGEVHPQFFALPKGEKAELLEEIAEQAERRRGHLRDEGDEGETPDGDANETGNEDETGDAEAARKAAAMAEGDEEAPRKRGGDRDRKKPPIYRRYRIQDILKEGQKILVQVVKEERGSKGAALTTYFSMPGRYTVLMPNTPYAGGISRKITDQDERKQLRDMYAALKIPSSMGLIIRTAGLGQEVSHIQRDYENLRNLWEHIQKEFTGNDDIQCVHEDGSLIIRAIRDMMSDDIDEVLISGKRAYKVAKDYAKNLMPDTAKIIKEYKEETPLFGSYKVEQKLNHLHFSRVTLPSGGYMIINPTEALVAVDINSGRNTHERNIEETALRTNLEACDELGRQIRLRDLAGLIVVDFIDMEDNRNVRKVENAMRKVLRKDRARVQYTNISDFGLMEISRQRLRPSFGESHFVTCPHCQGSGHVHAPGTAALMVLRRLEEEDVRTADRVMVTASTSLVLWILNNKRSVIADMEARNKYHLIFKSDDDYVAPDHKLELVRVKADGTETTQTVEVKLREQPEAPAEHRGRSSRGRGRDDERGGERRESRESRRRDDEREERGERSERGGDRDRRRSRDDDDTERKTSKREEGDESSSEGRGESREGRGGRRERGDRNGRGRDRDGGSSRRPFRVDEDGAEGAPERAAERKERRDDKRDEAVREETPVKARRKPEAEEKPVTRVAAPVEPAEDKPLLVQKVAAADVDDETPVIVPSSRKKLPVRVQEDTDAADVPLQVERIADADKAEAKATKARKGIIGRIIG